MRKQILTLKNLIVIGLVACGEPQPVATGTKAPGLKPLSASAPAAATASSSNQTAGDATKGKTALTSNCETCHGKSAHALTKADVSKIDSAGASSYHTSVAAAFKSSAADIKAYLATK